MTAPTNATPIARLLDALRNAECAGLGFAALADEGDVGHRAAFKVMRESLEKIQAARREYERAAERENALLMMAKIRAAHNERDLARGGEA